MPALPGTRIRDNGVFGNITDNPLTVGASTFNSPDLADLSVVLGDHAIVTLDPLKEFGDPEIVMVTAHTAAAAVATIQRGMYGTTPRQHPQNTLWVHAATTDDYTEIVTSVTRPADFYAGQRVFEIDTGLYVHRDQANSAWVPEVPTIQVFTSSGTWNKPAGLKAVKVRLVGGGGAGGGAAATSGSERSATAGGGGGGYAESIIPAVSLSGTETVTIGAGGVAVLGGNGGNGGTTSFGSLVVATGGGGAAAGIAVAVDVMYAANAIGQFEIAGIGTVGDLLVAGESGSPGFVQGLQHMGGAGGGNPLGGGGQGLNGQAVAANGVPGRTYGGGGGGSHNSPSQGAKIGGNGAAGVVIVEHYF